MPRAEIASKQAIFTLSSFTPNWREVCGKTERWRQNQNGHDAG
jgi:hypothetical protein